MSHMMTANPQLYARAAALIGLVGIANGIFAEAFVRGRLLVSSDAAATAQNIIDSEGLFRAGFMSDVTLFVIDIIITVILYALLKPVNRNIAIMAVLFRVTMSAIQGLNLLHLFAPILILNSDLTNAAFNTEQLQALSMLSLNLYSAGYALGLIFFGVHCFLVAYLLFNARYFPGFLGILFFVTALSYLAIGITYFAFPDMKAYSAYLLAPAALGEFVFTGWLLFKGVNLKKWNQQRAELGMR